MAEGNMNELDYKVARAFSITCSVSSAIMCVAAVMSCGTTHFICSLCAPHFVTLLTVLFGVPGNSSDNPGAERVEVECGSLSRVLSGGSILCIGNCFLMGFSALLSAFALHHLDPAADAERHRRRRRNRTFAGISMQGWRPVVAIIGTFEALVNGWLAFMIFAAVDQATHDEAHGELCVVAMQNITLRIACFSQAFAAASVSSGHFISLFYWLFLQIYHLRPRPPPSACNLCPCFVSCGAFADAMSFRRLVAIDSPPASPPVPAAVMDAAAAAAPGVRAGAAAEQDGRDVDVAVAFAAVAAALDAAAAEAFEADAGGNPV
jgi:hypothetical protein